jgi:flagellum-specific peptidoglycan hydrolase FlgJ
MPIVPSEDAEQFRSDQSDQIEQETGISGTLSQLKQASSYDPAADAQKIADDHQQTVDQASSFENSLDQLRALGATKAENLVPPPAPTPPTPAVPDQVAGGTSAISPAPGNGGSAPTSQPSATGPLDALQGGLNALGAIKDQVASQVAQVPQRAQETAQNVGSAIGGAAQGVQRAAENVVGHPSANTDLNAVTPDSTNRDSFIKSTTPLAQAWEAKTGIPAAYFLAVNGSESNWGKAPGNELFGIKAKAGNASTGPLTTWEQGQGSVQDSFSAYPNANAAYADFIDLISHGRYEKAWNQFQQDHDPAALFRNVNSAGYATDPQWGNKIAQIAGGINVEGTRPVEDRTADIGQTPQAGQADVLAKAQPFLGQKYVWGGKDPNTGFDCSGLAGYLTTGQPESTRTLYSKSSPISAGDAQPGDLVFYNMSGSTGPADEHVATYIGNGQIVQAGGTQHNVNVANANQFSAPGWQPEFRRVTGTPTLAKSVTATPGPDAVQQPDQTVQNPAAATPRPDVKGLQDMWNGVQDNLGQLANHSFSTLPSLTDSTSQAVHMANSVVLALTGQQNNLPKLDQPQVDQKQAEPSAASPISPTAQSPFPNTPLATSQPVPPGSPLAKAAAGQTVTPEESLQIPDQLAHSINPVRDVPVIGKIVDGLLNPSNLPFETSIVGLGAMGAQVVISDLADQFIAPDDPNRGLKASVIGMVGGLAAAKGLEPLRPVEEAVRAMDEPHVVEAIDHVFHHSEHGQIRLGGENWKPNPEFDPNAEPHPDYHPSTGYTPPAPAPSSPAAPPAPAASQFDSLGRRIPAGAPENPATTENLGGFDQLGRRIPPGETQNPETSQDLGGYVQDSTETARPPVRGMPLESRFTPQGNLNVTDINPDASRFVRQPNNVIKPVPDIPEQPESDIATGLIAMARAKGTPDYQIGMSLHNLGMSDDQIEQVLARKPSDASQTVSKIMRDAEGRPVGNQLSPQVDRVDRGLPPVGEPVSRGVIDTNGAPLPGANPDIQSNAAEYNAKYGLPEPRATRYVKPDEETQSRIAQIYDQTPSNPNDPKVRDAYSQLNKEVQQQYDFLTKEKGVTFEPYGDNDPSPYPTSGAMMADLRDNNHLFVYNGGTPNELMTPEQNFMFRAVHDYFGHAASGLSFGPRGEENAWLDHSKMFSPLARQAMTTETRGQNSWVNFGPNGATNRANPLNTQFADQKALILPDEFHSRADAEIQPNQPPTQQPSSGGLGSFLRSRQSGQVALGSASHPDEGVQATLANGGATIDPHTLQPVELKDGFVVSRPGGMVVDQAKFTPALLERFAQEHADNGGLVGAWVDNGKVYLDVSDVVPDQETAMKMGAQSDQLAIYDVAGGKAIDVPKAESTQYDRYYHGTGSAFESPTGDKFDPNGLFGPGYYLTDNPDVAGGVVAQGGEPGTPVRDAATSARLGTDVSYPTERYPGDVISPGYAQQRQPNLMSNVQMHASNHTFAQKMMADAEASGDPARIAKAQANLQQAEQSMTDAIKQAVNGPAAGPNVRVLDVPQEMNLFDADKTYTPDEARQIAASVPNGAPRLQHLIDTYEKGQFGRSGDIPGQQIYDVLGMDATESAGKVYNPSFAGPQGAANDLLSQAGFDGIRYNGGTRVPMNDAAGNPIQHNALVVFPESLSKIRNALSGKQGGYVRLGTAQNELHQVMETAKAHSVADLSASDIAKLPGMQGATQGGDAISEAIRIGKPFARAYQEYGGELQTIFGDKNLHEAITAWGLTAANSGTGVGGAATVSLMRAVRQVDKEGLLTPENLQHLSDLQAKSNGPLQFGKTGIEQNPIMQRVWDIVHNEDRSMVMPLQVGEYMQALTTGEVPLGSYKLPSFAENTLTGALQQTDPNVHSFAVTVDRHIGRLVMSDKDVQSRMQGISAAKASTDWYASMKSLITQAGAEQGITNPYEAQAAAWEPVRMLIGGGVAEKAARKAVPGVQDIAKSVLNGSTTLGEGLREADKLGFFSKHFQEGFEWAGKSGKPITTMDMYTEPKFQQALKNAKEAGIDLQSPTPSAFNANPRITSSHPTSFWQEYGRALTGSTPAEDAPRNGVFSDKFAGRVGGPTGFQMVETVPGAAAGAAAGYNSDQDAPMPERLARGAAGAVIGGAAGYGLARGLESKFGQFPSDGEESSPPGGAQRGAVGLGVLGGQPAGPRVRFTANGAIVGPTGVNTETVDLAHQRIDRILASNGPMAVQQAHNDFDNLLFGGAAPDEIARFFAGISGDKASIPDIIRTVRTGSMAGGVATMGKVALGPVIQTAMHAPVGAIKSIVEGKPQNIPLGLQGGLAGLAEGAADGLQTARYGINYRQALTGGAQGGYGFKPGIDVTGGNLATRTAGAAATGLVRLHGAVADISAGIGRGAAEATGATPAAAQETGQQWALRSGEYGAIGKAVSNALEGFKKTNPALDVVGQILIPFYRVGYNVTTQGIERSPVGLLGRVTDAIQGKPLDTGKLYNNLFGVGLAAGAFAAASQGNVTGEHPNDPNAPKWSFKVGSKWMPLRVLGPAGESLAQAADLYESARDGHGDVAMTAEKLASNYIGHIYDETWLRGVGDTIGTVEDVKNLDQPGDTGRQAQKDLGFQATSLGKSFIPQGTLIGQAKSVDEPNKSVAQVANSDYYKAQPEVTNRLLSEFHQTPQYKNAAPAERYSLDRQVETSVNDNLRSQYGVPAFDNGNPPRYVGVSDRTLEAQITSAHAKVAAYDSNPRSAPRPTVDERVLAKRAVESPQYKTWAKTHANARNDVSTFVDNAMKSIPFSTPNH